MTCNLSLVICQPWAAIGLLNITADAITSPGTLILRGSSAAEQAEDPVSHLQKLYGLGLVLN